jgi:hypothetical protein
MKSIDLDRKFTPDIARAGWGIFVSNAMGAPVSRNWKGYLQRAA